MSIEEQKKALLEKQYSLNEAFISLGFLMNNSQDSKDIVLKYERKESLLLQQNKELVKQRDDYQELNKQITNKLEQLERDTENRIRARALILEEQLTEQKKLKDDFKRQYENTFHELLIAKNQTKHAEETAKEHRQTIESQELTIRELKKQSGNSAYIGQQFHDSVFEMLKEEFESICTVQETKNEAHYQDVLLTSLYNNEITILIEIKKRKEIENRSFTKLANDEYQKFIDDTLKRRPKMAILYCNIVIRNPNALIEQFLFNGTQICLLSQQTHNVLKKQIHDFLHIVNQQRPLETPQHQMIPTTQITDHEFRTNVAETAVVSTSFIRYLIKMFSNSHKILSEMCMKCTEFGQEYPLHHGILKFLNEELAGRGSQWTPADDCIRKALNEFLPTKFRLKAQTPNTVADLAKQEIEKIRKGVISTTETKIETIKTVETKSEMIQNLSVKKETKKRGPKPKNTTAGPVFKIGNFLTASK